MRSAVNCNVPPSYSPLSGFISHIASAEGLHSFSLLFLVLPELEYDCVWSCIEQLDYKHPIHSVCLQYLGWRWAETVQCCNSGQKSKVPGVFS